MVSLHTAFAHFWLEFLHQLGPMVESKWSVVLVTEKKKKGTTYKVPLREVSPFLPGVTQVEWD